MDKIIFFHMNQLGDLLFSLPVIQAARKRYPDAKIYSVARKNLAQLLNSTGLSDKIFIKEKSFFKKLKLIKDIRKENADAAVLFSESPETLITAFLSNIKERAGFGTAGLSFLLTKKAPKTGVPSLSNNTALAQIFGVTGVKNDYLNILNIDKSADNIVSQWLAENNIPNKDFAVISFGASARRREKCLRDEVWIETINKLRGKNVRLVAAGARWEKDAINGIVNKCAGKVNVFCPQGGLLELAALLKRAKLFIGIDSGAMHLSASLGVKCIALYGATDPSQIGPQPPSEHIIIKKDNAKDISCDDIINAFERYEKQAV